MNPLAVIPDAAENGEAVGRDPRKMPKADLEALGHSQKPLTKIIRAKCLDCCSGQATEVQRCVSHNCTLWPYRMGTNPLLTKRTLSEEHKRALLGSRKQKASEAS